MASGRHKPSLCLGKSLPFLLLSSHHSSTSPYSLFSPSSSSSTSSLLTSWKKMWCVFVIWMVFSSDCCGIIKMSSAADSAVTGSVSTGGGGGSDSTGANGDGGGSAGPQCVLKGRVYTERLWYGYLIDKAFHRDYAKIQYTISYPVKECCTNLLIYYDDQIKQLTQDMTCEERQRVLPNNNNQVIPLHTLNRTVGCRVWNETDEPYYVCVGERIFRSSGPRTWYFALSRCGAKTPLTVNYAFNVSGYYGDCEEDPLVRTYIPPSPKDEDNVYVSLALGIVAGLALIAALVFFALWFLARRRAATSKGSSVTSSQATMTQDDIFYVNPSLSDRGERPDYGASQAGSENYYEVIPERRSYESINPHLLAAGGGGVVGVGAGGVGGHHPLLHHGGHHAGGHHPHLAHHHHHLQPGHHATHPRHSHHQHSAGAGPVHTGPHATHGPHAAHATHLKESAFHRPHPAAVAGYPMFDDYPPPPYQPPRMLTAGGGGGGGGGAGGGMMGGVGPKHHTLHHPVAHHHQHNHSLSLTSTRPRPPLLHPTHAPSLSFPSSSASVLSPQQPLSSTGLTAAGVGGGGIPSMAPPPTLSANVTTALVNVNNNNNNNNNSGGNLQNIGGGGGGGVGGISASAAISMNTTTNSVSLGETTA